MDTRNQHPGGMQSFWTSKVFLMALAAGGVAILLLWPKHQGHLAVLLPYLFLLACPLMHLFHHRGHHGAPTEADAKQHDAEAANSGGQPR